MNSTLKERFELLLKSINYKINKDGFYEISISDVLDLPFDGEETGLFMEYLNESNYVITDPVFEGGYLTDSFIEKGDLNSTNMYINEIMRIPLLSHEEEEKYLKLYKETHDESLKKLICERNLKLVFSIAKNRKYANKGLSFLDLVQEGNIGLLKAIDFFDCSKGNRFSTYATFSITTAIIDAIHDLSRDIRISDYTSNKIFAIKEFVDNFYAEHNRQPSVEEISLGTGIESEKVKEYMSFDYNIISLHTPVNDEEDSELSQLIVDKKQPFDERIVNDDFYKILISEIDKVLNDREVYIINTVYGINGYTEDSCAGIARSYGISHQAVNEIKKKALNKLKYRYTCIFAKSKLDIKSNLSR